MFWINWSRRGQAADMALPTRSRKQLLWAAMLACGVLTGVQAEDQALPVLGDSLQGLIDYAREHNPELAGRQLAADAARERIESVSALPDPKFQLELMDFTNTMSGGGTSLLPGDVGQTRYRIIQPIPYWGKRDLRGQVATAQAGQSATAVNGSLRDIVARISIAYARYYQAVQQAQILNENLSLLQALDRLVETRYSLGLVPQQDVIRAQTEITGLKVELIDAEQRRRDAAAVLNAQLPRQADAPLASPAALSLPASRYGLSELIDKARLSSPELARDRFGIEAASKNRDLTYRNRYPDFSLGLTNNQPKTGEDTWDLMLEVSIPLQQSARRSQEHDADLGVRVATNRLQATEARLFGRIGEVHASFEASHDKAALLRDTLSPQASSNLQSAQAGYESGRVNFNTLIEAERQVLRTRLSLLNAEVETLVRYAELEQLVGEPL